MKYKNDVRIKSILSICSYLPLFYTRNSHDVGILQFLHMFSAINIDTSWSCALRVTFSMPMSVQVRSENVQTFFKNQNIHHHSRIQHDKCIHMSTNILGALQLNILLSASNKTKQKKIKTKKKPNNNKQTNTQTKTKTMKRIGFSHWQPLHVDCRLGSQNQINGQRRVKNECLGLIFSDDVFQRCVKRVYLCS